MGGGGAVVNIFIKTYYFPAMQIIVWQYLTKLVAAVVLL